MPRPTRLLLCLASVFMIGAVGFAAEPEAAIAPIATVPLLSTAPTIDGKFDEAEWAECLRLTGFRAYRGTMEARHTTGYAGFTRERLYLAVVSEISPIGPFGEPAMRDSQTISDSGVEFWIDPNQDRRDDPDADKRYFQVMVTPFGTLRDMQLDTAGSPTTGWDPEVEYAYSLDQEARRWYVEYSISWKDLGQEGDMVGRDIGLILSRNYKRPFRQATGLNFPPNVGYNTVQAYPKIRLRADEPVMRVMSLGDKFWDGILDLSAQIRNPGPARQVTVHVYATSDTMPERTETVTLDLPANGVAVYDMNVGNFFHAKDKHQYTLTMTDAKTGQVYFHNPVMPWTAPPVDIWKVRTDPQPERALGIRFYPSTNRLIARVEPSYLGEAFDSVKSARLGVTRADGSPMVALHEVTWEGAKGEFAFDLPPVPEGLYTVHAEVPGYTATKLERQFRRIIYPWETEKVGVTTTIYPPFEAMTLTNRNLGVVLRRYQVGSLGLWDRVEARGQGRDDGYRELLARPMTLIVDGDKPISGSGDFTTHLPHEVTYAGAGEGGGLAVTTRTITEYDGCMKVILTLNPEGKRVDLQSLWLDIPLKDEEVSLFHVSTTGLRQNPAGHIPAGDGLIWDTRKFPDGEWYGGFLPYIWLGTEARGFCWFADNDKGWITDYNIQKNEYAPAFSLIRQDGVLTLRINLVQKPASIDTAREIVFGVMATPAKPMPTDWRRLGRSDYKGLNFSMPRLMGIPAQYAGKYPYNKDFTIFDANQAARRDSTYDWKADVTAWKQRYGENVHEELGMNGAKRGLSASDNYFSVYFDEFHSVAQHEETIVFWSEWSGNEIRLIDPPALQDTMLPSVGSGAIVPSYQDFATYWAREWLRRGAGIYFDNAFPKRVYDLETTAAYRLPTGHIQPSAGMWNHREYLKRIWVLHQQERLADTPQMMMIHMTNTHIVPYMVWNESNLDLEYLYGPHPAQAKYAADLLRAETIGLQSGNLPIASASAQAKGSKVSKEQQDLANRTRWAALFVHEIKPGISVSRMPEVLDTFGYGLDDCVVYNYWDRDSPVTVSDARVKTLLLKRNGELLLLVVTWNGAADTVTITLDTDALQLSPTAATNAETGDAMAWQDQTVTLDLPRYGVALVKLH